VPVQAVMVNHNTSAFAELALRSLLHTDSLSNIDLKVTVLDNASDDDHVCTLKAYLQAHGFRFVQTGFNNEIDSLKHPYALEQFLKEEHACQYYLFMDADIWFEEKDVLQTMLADLQAIDHRTFACQPRIWEDYDCRRFGRCKKQDLGNAYTFEYRWKDGRKRATYDYRCNPACCLVKNTATFKRVVNVIGLSFVSGYARDGCIHAYDTFSLMTHVMGTHGYSFIVSSKCVNHFQKTVWCPNESERLKRLQDCHRMLNELRGV
jgi:hypothetical protein